MEGEDPWLWDIDRVVRELCTSQRTWPMKSPSQRLPDPVSLERAIREQDCDGATLLMDVNHEVLRNDFGLRVLGQRGTIMYAIGVFQRRSPRYQEWIGSDPTPQVRSYTADPTCRSGSEIVSAAGRRLDEASGSILHENATVTQFATSLKAVEPESSSVGRDGMGWIADSNGNKRRRLSLTMIDGDLTPLVEGGSKLFNGMSEPGEVTNHVIENGQAHGLQSVTPDKASKKRKRIQPTLITPLIDTTRDREIPTEADTVIAYDPLNLEHGTVYVGDDGRKRLILAPQVESDREWAKRLQNRFQNASKSTIENTKFDRMGGLTAAEEILRAANKNKHDDSINSPATGYLGKKRHLVDEIFYGNSRIGKELAPTNVKEDFVQFGPADISCGRRLYVNDRMKHFFRSGRLVTRRDNKFYSALIPYPSRLAPIHQSPSFTLLHATANGDVQATREQLSKWPDLDPIQRTTKDAKLDGERRANFDLPEESILGGPSSYDNWDPSLLEKYRYMDGGDEILPLFGDSDSDGEYDYETMREIEEEFGAQNQPLLPSKRRILTADEVNDAIDEGIAQMVVDWHKNKLPKRQLGAWRLWMKSRRDSTKRTQIRDAQDHLNRINNQRLPKMRKEFLDDVWTSSKQVLKQTRCMEQSIHDREDSIWQISVLESTHPPAKPDRRSIPKKKKVVDLASMPDDDGESLESESDMESSDDGLDDFVVKDQDALTVEDEELRAGDAEDEDNDTSDIEARSNGPSETDNRNSCQKIVLKLPKNGAVAAQLGENGVELVGAQMDEEMLDASRIHLQSSSPPRTLSPAIMGDDPQLPQHKPQSLFSHRSAAFPSSPDVIDLTLLTSDSSGYEIMPRSREVVNLVTPEKPKLNGFGNTSTVPRFKSIFKLETTPSEKSFVDISDSEDPFEQELPGILPDLSDASGITKYPPSLWSEAGDRERLIAAVIHNMKQSVKDGMLELINSRTEDELWQSVLEVMHACRDNEEKVRGMDPQTFLTLTGVIRLFEMYVDCRFRKPHTLRPATARKLEESVTRFSPFYRLCRQILKSESDIGSESNPKPELEQEDEDGEPLSASKRQPRPLNASDEDVALQESTPYKTRKKLIFENAQARDLREQNLQRLREQEERRQVLRHRLAQSGTTSNADRAKIIINEGKFDDQGFVYVNEQIGIRIKNHQVDGIRFMWSQIVANGGVMQGCLLAHTMGLGKTMQVITLLVAINEASLSPDPTVSSQIPESLQVSRTLILCPPGLINNWMDELLTWVPDGVDLGGFRKIDASVKSLGLRLGIIGTWHTDGGVLILGYEMFRNLVLNRATAKREAPLDEVQHAQVLDQLLQGPNIVIADEAHKMKNVSASITSAASQFRTNSRIALTGSPLANNVEEYHTMIEWVAPNYLGPAVEFRAKYVEPIQQGLWHDSSGYERRKSLKMLRVLKEDLMPKVHRADMSVLRDDLPPKVEFVITVPLTDLQHKAYSIYVNAMSREKTLLSKNGEVLQTTLWHWLAILSLLCNHPESFRAKLSEREEDAHKAIKARAMAKRLNLSSDDDSIAEEINMPVWKAGVSEELIREEMALFKDHGYIGAIDNSNKVKILVQILDACRAAKDKVLIFSQSIPTLNYLEGLCERTGRKYARLDGSTNISKRQGLTKEFNTGSTELYLISTTAGGLGLNLPGANRVIIFDFKFNPIMEEQAVGRAYRIGQKKPVFVYRFVAGGTFEDRIHNQAVFKMQLASRVVDKKNPVAWAKRKVGDFLFEPKPVRQEDLSEFKGIDLLVLDGILERQNEESTIRAIVMTDTFERHDDDKLTAEEELEAQQLLGDEKLKRSDPQAYQALLLSRERDEQLRLAALHRNIINSAAFQNALPVGTNFTAYQIPYPTVGNSQNGSVILSSNLSSSEFGGSYRVEPAGLEPSSTSVGASLRDSILAPVAGANTRIRESSPRLDTSKDATGAVVISNLTSESANGVAPENRHRHTTPIEGRRQLPVLGLPPTVLSIRDNTFQIPDKAEKASIFPSSDDISEPASPDLSDYLAKKFLVGLKVGRLLGNYIFPAEVDQQRLMNEIASSIMKAIERRSQSDDSLMIGQCRQVNQSLKEDPQLCDKLFSGTLTANGLVTLLLGQALPSDVSLGFDHRIKANNEHLRRSLGLPNPLPHSSDAKDSAPTESSSQQSTTAQKNGVCEPLIDTFSADFASKVAEAFPNVASVNDIKSKADEFAKVLYQKTEAKNLFESATKTALRQVIQRHSLCRRLILSQISVEEFTSKLVAFVSKNRTLTMDGPSDGTKILAPRSLKTPLPKRNKHRKELESSPKAEADRAYLEKMEARRRSRYDFPSPAGFPSVLGSQPPKLPQWALSKVKEAKTRGQTSSQTPRPDIYDLDDPS